MNRNKYSIGASRLPDCVRHVWLDNLTESAAMHVLHFLAPFQRPGEMISVQNETTAKRMKAMAKIGKCDG